jgi:hypothetical protein
VIISALNGAGHFTRLSLEPRFASQESPPV